MAVNARDAVAGGHALREEAMSTPWPRGLRFPRDLWIRFSDAATAAGLFDMCVLLNRGCLLHSLTPAGRQKMEETEPEPLRVDAGPEAQACHRGAEWDRWLRSCACHRGTEWGRWLQYQSPMRRMSPSQKRQRDFLLLLLRPTCRSRIHLLGGHRKSAQIWQKQPLKFATKQQRPRGSLTRFGASHQIVHPPKESTEDVAFCSCQTTFHHSSCSSKVHRHSLPKMMTTALRRSWLAPAFPRTAPCCCNDR